MAEAENGLREQLASLVRDRDEAVRLEKEAKAAHQAATSARLRAEHRLEVALKELTEPNLFDQKQEGGR